MSTDELEDQLRTRGPKVGELPDVAALADRAGLLDVAYASFDSPLGELLLAATETGLVQLAYVRPGQIDSLLARLAERVSPRILVAPRRLDEPRRELEEYFSGGRRVFEFALDGRLMSPFARRVMTATAAIPYGQMSTYAEVAARAGSPRGARAAGNALGANPLPIVLPCHRVLRSGGNLGGYTGGLDRKRALLAIEQGQPPLWPGAARSGS
ncbi:MAG TPA: methylated-DNA--[protein]-cysteine S-methyltransferase [Solirubrobacteraceae bacterium]